MGGDTDRRLTQLSEAELVTYQQFAEESVCRCDGSCPVDIYWPDMRPREDWLEKRMPSGIIVDRLWIDDEDNRGPTGSVYLDDDNTRGRKDPGADNDILRAGDV